MALGLGFGLSLWDIGGTTMPFVPGGELNFTDPANSALVTLLWGG